MKRLSLIIAILAMALLMACGGSGSGGGGGAAGGPSGDVVVIEVAVDDNGFISDVPIDIEGGEVFHINLNTGTVYEIHFTNHAVRVRSLLINRWGVEAIAQPGDTTISNQFMETEPGDYGCTEKILGGTDARFKCRVIVS